MSTTRLVAIPLFDRNSPSLRPDLGCLTHGWERRSSMAVRPPRQRRGACLRAVPSHATLAGRRARFHFRFPAALQRTGSGSGKPIKNCAHRAIKGRDPAQQPGPQSQQSASVPPPHGQPVQPLSRPVQRLGAPLPLPWQLGVRQYELPGRR